MSLSLNSLSTSPRSRKTKQKRTTRGDGDKKQAVECSALHVHGGVGWAAEGKERREKEEEEEESALSARGRRFFSSQPLPFPSKKKKIKPGSLLALGRASGETHLVDPDTGKTLATIPAAAAAAGAETADDEEENGDGDGKTPKKKKEKDSKKTKKPKLNPVRGLAFLYDAVGTGCTRFPLLVVASASGTVRVFSPPADFFSASKSSSSSDSSSSKSWLLVSKFDAAPQGGLRALSLAHSPGGVSSKGITANDASLPACIVRVAVVADRSELSIWDLATREKTFEAKGEKPDRLRLVDKAGGTSVAFLPDTDEQLVSAPSNLGGITRCSGALVAVGTGTGRVRLYDTRHGRRPVSSVVLSGDGGGGKGVGCSTSSSASATPIRNNGLSGAGAAVTTLVPEAGGAAFSRVWAGDSAGLLRSVDLRTSRPEGTLKGAAGGVRCAAAHPKAALVASVGADGFLRIHHARTRKLVGSLWLKQSLRSVCWCPVAAGAGGGGRSGGKEEEKKKKEKKEKKKSKKRPREEKSDDDDDEDEDASSSSDADSDSSSSESEDEQSFLEAADLSLLPPEEKDKKKRKKNKKKAVPPPLPGGKKEKKARKKGGTAKKNKLRKEAAKAAKQAKYAAARGNGGGGYGE